VGPSAGPDSVKEIIDAATENRTQILRLPSFELSHYTGRPSLLIIMKSYHDGDDDQMRKLISAAIMTCTSNFCRALYNTAILSFCMGVELGIRN
jgi:hypothetical protein